MDYPTQSMPQPITLLANKYIEQQGWGNINSLSEAQQNLLCLYLKDELIKDPFLKRNLFQPMLDACKTGDSNTVAYLIALGIDVNAFFETSQVTFTDISRSGEEKQKTEDVYDTFLTLATQAGHLEVVRTLLKAGANPNLSTQHPHEVYLDPLKLCQTYINIPHRFEIALLLLQHGASPYGLEGSFGSHTSALDFAVSHKQLPLIEQLRKMGERKVSAGNWDKCVALGLAPPRAKDRFDTSISYELPPLLSSTVPSLAMAITSPPLPLLTNSQLTDLPSVSRILNITLAVPEEIPPLFKDAKLNTRIQNQETLMLGWYFSYGNNASHPHRHLFNVDPFSKHILNVKDDYPNKAEWQKKSISESFGYYTNLLSPLIMPGSILAVIPSSNPNKKWHGITKMIMICAKKLNLIDGSGLLIRKHEIQKLAGNASANRSLGVHQDSLAIANPAGVKGKTILLIDDVSTTGNSLTVAIEKFQEAGAHKIVCLILGKTAPGHAFVAYQQHNPESSPINPSPAQKRLNKLIRNNPAIQTNRQNFATLVEEAQTTTQAYNLSLISPPQGFFAPKKQISPTQPVNPGNHRPTPP